MTPKRLLWQLYPACLVVTLVSLAAMTWYASAALHGFSIEHTADELRRSPAGGRAVPRPGRRRQVRRINVLCKSLGEKSGTRLTVILPDGTVKGDSVVAQPVQMENHANRPEVAAALKGEVGTSLHDSQTLNEKYRYVAVPLRSGEHVVGVLRGFALGHRHRPGAGRRAAQHRHRLAGRGRAAGGR